MDTAAVKTSQVKSRMKIAGVDFVPSDIQSRLIDFVPVLGYSRDLLHGSSPPILGRSPLRPFFCLEKAWLK